VRGLNEAAGDGAAYKVLFLGRHGQGWHNVAESKYGTKAWDVSSTSPALHHGTKLTSAQCYYSALDGYDNLTWADALLTPTGQQQALDAHKLWATQLPLGLPAPETFYVSPLTRAIETADLTFQHLALPADRPYAPLAKELVREVLGVHTCDRRSTRSAIATKFPHVRFEDGFEEEDGLWLADYREPRTARRYRLAMLLDDVFASDEGVVLSITSHSGAIESMLEKLGHRRFALKTGGVIPVIVKAEKVHGERELPKKEPSSAPPMCDAPPEV
jgi:broad specificity phosphatase PhoE